MRILVTGKGGKGGSWRIRGEQLGNAINAKVVSQAELGDCKAADRIVIVKRIPSKVLAAVQAAGGRWIWDTVDAWPQPEGNSWDRVTAVGWLQGIISETRPTAIVFPTTRMLEDSQWSGPSIVLPHHAWPKYQRNEVRKVPYIVAYEGGKQYLGAWRPALEQACIDRGWVFCANDDMTRADIGIALRDCEGYPAAAWKSNVKLANLQALGVPAICSPEEGYKEFCSGAEIFANDPTDLPDILDGLRPLDVRREIANHMYAAAPRLEVVAERYRKWLGQLSF